MEVRFDRRTFGLAFAALTFNFSAGCSTHSDLSDKIRNTLLKDELFCVLSHLENIKKKDLLKPEKYINDQEECKSLLMKNYYGFVASYGQFLMRVSQFLENGESGNFDPEKIRLLHEISEIKESEYSSTLKMQVFNGKLSYKEGLNQGTERINNIIKELEALFADQAGLELLEICKLLSAADRELNSFTNLISTPEYYKARENKIN